MEPVQKFRVADLIQEQTFEPATQSQPKSAPLITAGLCRKFIQQNYKPYAIILLLYTFAFSAYAAYQIWSKADQSVIVAKFTQKFRNKWDLAFEKQEGNEIITKNFDAKLESKLDLSTNEPFHFLINQKKEHTEMVTAKFLQQSQNLEIETNKSLDLKISQVKNNLNELKQDIISTIPIPTQNFYQEKAHNDVNQFITYGNQWNELRHLYYQQVLKIEEVARHNTINVFKLKEKDIHSPFADEYEMLKRSVIDVNDPKIQLKFEKLKEEHELYLKKIMHHELDELVESELSPARKLLVEEEKKLRNLWFEMETVKGLYLQCKDNLDKNKSQFLHQEQLKYMLGSATWLMKSLENLMQAKYEPTKVWKSLEIQEIDPQPYTPHFYIVGIVTLVIMSLVITLQFISYKNQPILQSLQQLKQTLNKQPDFLLDEKFLSSRIEENAFHFEMLRQKAKFLNRIDRHCGVILINSINNLSATYWCRLIASAGPNICWLVQKEIEGELLSQFQLHQPIQHSLSEYLTKKVNLSNVVYATNFKNLFVASMDSKSRLPVTNELPNLKQTMNDKFDYLIVSCHPNQVKNFYKYFGEQIEYQINCIFEDQSTVDELFLEMESKHPETQILNAFISKNKL